MARCIPAEPLEQEIWAEVRKVLTASEVVLHEQQEPEDAGAVREDIERLQSEIASLRKREERLVKLFGFDEVDSEVVREEFRDVQRRREVLSERWRHSPALNRPCAMPSTRMPFVGAVQSLPRVWTALDQRSRNWFWRPFS